MIKAARKPTRTRANIWVLSLDGCAMKDKAAFLTQTTHGHEATLCERLSLLIAAHVQICVLHATCTREVIANQIQARWFQNLGNAGMQGGRMSLVPKFVYSLMRDDKIEGAQINVPC